MTGKEILETLISKGFKISGDVAISPEDKFRIHLERGECGIRPYMFKIKRGVKIRIYASTDTVNWLDVLMEYV